MSSAFTFSESFFYGDKLLSETFRKIEHRLVTKKKSTRYTGDQTENNIATYDVEVIPKPIRKRRKQISTDESFLFVLKDYFKNKPPFSRRSDIVFNSVFKPISNTRICDDREEQGGYLLYLPFLLYHFFKF